MLRTRSGRVFAGALLAIVVAIGLGVWSDVRRQRQSPSSFFGSTARVPTPFSVTGRLLDLTPVGAPTDGGLINSRGQQYTFALRLDPRVVQQFHDCEIGGVGGPACHVTVQLVWDGPEPGNQRRRLLAVAIART